MSQADDDAQKWMEANAKWQYRELIRAKESGKAYFIDKNGYVNIEEKKDGQKQVD